MLLQLILTKMAGNISWKTRSVSDPNSRHVCKIYQIKLGAIGWVPCSLGSQFRWQVINATSACRSPALFSAFLNLTFKFSSIFAMLSPIFFYETYHEKNKGYPKKGFHRLCQKIEKQPFCIVTSIPWKTSLSKPPPVLYTQLAVRTSTTSIYSNHCEETLWQHSKDRNFPVESSSLLTGLFFTNF